MTMTHTHTRTYTATHFADPYKVCVECNGWVDGVLDAPTLILLPCHHQADYLSVCPSWGPVDGCQCVEHLGRRPHPERDR